MSALAERSSDGPLASSSTTTTQSAPFFWNAETTAAFPPAFRQFLEANDIHPDNYAISDVPRYVRVSPTHATTLTQTELERQLGTAIEPVDWLTGYFCVPSHIKIAGCDAYRSGRLYGIDVSSGAAVAALDPQPGDNVLDLCCAPGAKLCAIADYMGPSGTLTGVDVSEERLAACRTLCLKYGVANARLLLQDGAQPVAPPPQRIDEFEAACDDDAAGEEEKDEEDAAADDGSPHNNHHRSVPHRARKRRRHEQHGAFFLGSDLDGAGAAAASAAVVDESPAAAAGSYDRVLVDAECTHDGSIKHLAKFAQWGWDTFERRFLQPERLTDLAKLQMELLRSGYRVLKPGGTLVYSTCSFAKAQNEEIVSALLAEAPGASLVPIAKLEGAPCKAGALPHTLRFEPRTSKTSGLFVACLTKSSSST